MILNRTPYRIRFFEEGSDVPQYSNGQGSAILAAAIDKYSYISCRKLPPFFDHNYRIVYSKHECVKNIEDIAHPAVREVLSYLSQTEGVELHHDSDLPGRTGLGSETSFCMGLLESLYALRGRMVSCEQLVKDAIYIQQNRLHECVGASDAAIISRGGFAKINVSAEGNYRIQPVAVAATRLQEFQRHLLFCFMGACPSPQEVLLSEQPPDSATANGNAIDEAIAAITEPHRDIRDVGALLDQVWKQRVSNMENDKSNAILRHYEAARRAGAIGGRALGGTFGWFLLLVAHPNHHSAVWSALGKPLIVPISFDYSGTQLMLYQP